MSGTEGGRGCPRPRGWSAAASAVADTETKARSGSRLVRPLPASPAGAPAGAGAAGREGKGKEEKGREGKGGRPAQHAAPRPGTPPQSIVRGAAALRSRRAEPGQGR